jgi:PIN domain nuclease of toxin-antitoxin system
MRYYLDTNVLIFILLKEYDNIHRDVWKIIDDYSSLLYVSAVAVKELIHLYKTGDIKDKDFKTAKDLLDAIEKSEIEIKPLNRYHLSKYAEMDIVKGHKDPNDHIIIAQAMSDKIPLISSDHQFPFYAEQGLSCVFNKR